MHDVDLLLLGDDDLLGQPLQALVLAVAKLDERHVDGALVVRDHHAGEVPVGVAGEGHLHRAVHLCGRPVHQRSKAVNAVGILLNSGILLNGARGRRQREQQKSNEPPALQLTSVHVEGLHRHRLQGVSHCASDSGPPCG